MADIKVAVDARGLDWTLALIAATRGAATLLRDCQLKLSVSLRADDPLLERIEKQLTAFGGLATSDPGTELTPAQRIIDAVKELGGTRLEMGREDVVTTMFPDTFTPRITLAFDLPPGSVELFP